MESLMLLRSFSLVQSFALCLLLLQFLGAQAQVLGTDIFICSPTFITFTLNFSSGCPGSIENGTGIVGTECEFIFNETQLLPIVSVETFQVQELGLDLRTLGVQNFGPLSDGATVEWNSTSSQNVTDESKIPGGLQFNIVGKTASGLTIVNSAIVQYSNNGNVSPIFEVGDQIGWTVFSVIGPAPPEYCPAVSSAPVSVAPATAAPTTLAPVTAEPTTGAPVTAEPTTGAPVTAEPTTVAPVTSAPTSSAPVTIAPTSLAPVTKSPITDAPISLAPVTGAPSTGAPATKAPVTSGPTSVPVSTLPVTTPSDAPLTLSPSDTPTSPVGPVTMPPFDFSLSMSFDYDMSMSFSMSFSMSYDLSEEHKEGKKGKKGKKGDSVLPRTVPKVGKKTMKTDEVMKGKKEKGKKEAVKVKESKMEKKGKKSSSRRIRKALEFVLA